ncbi:MAG: multidrug ABC transporter [Lachnospiraceae bacterium]|nr:multidrug ABC transporter [Lachnospiraceae bacterium]
MNSVFFLVALCSVTIASFSQVLLKMGAGKTYASKIREYLNFFVITGYGMLFLSMVLTIVAYSHLSYLSVPVVEAVGYVLVPVLSYFIFKEKLSKRKILGIVFILAGIIIYYL